VGERQGTGYLKAQAPRLPPLQAAYKAAIREAASESDTQTQVLAAGTT